MNKKRLITILAICGALIIIGGGYKMYSSHMEEKAMMAEKIKAQEDLIKAKEKAEEEQKRLEKERSKLKEEAEKKKQAEEKAKQDKVKQANTLYGCTIVDDNKDAIQKLQYFSGAVVECFREVSMANGSYQRGEESYASYTNLVNEIRKQVGSLLNNLNSGVGFTGQPLKIPRSQVSNVKGLYSILQSTSKELSAIVGQNKRDLSQNYLNLEQRACDIKLAISERCNQMGVKNLI